jgi:plastocyanin
MKTSTALVIFVAILIIGGGAWWFMNQNSSMPQGATVINVDQGNENTLPDTTNASSTTTTASSTSTTAVKTVTINYSSAAGFSPANVTINKGDTVKFVSTDGSPMWVASDEHPSHTEFDGTSRTTHCAAGYTGAIPFDQCAPGASYSFTFTKTGSFDFHNHVSASRTGVVTVK